MALTKLTTKAITGDTLDAGDLAANSVDSSELVDGSVDLSHLSASGTKSSSTYLRGDNTFATVSGTTINNNANNRIITGSASANTLEGESAFTFDPAADPPLLYLENGIMEMKRTVDAPAMLRFDAPRGAGGDSLGDIEWQWDNNTNAKIYATAGADTTNKDEANIDFQVRDAGGSMTTAMHIHRNAKIGIGDGDPLGKLHIKTADSGVSSVNAHSDELVLEGSAHSGMSILSGTSSAGFINFGDSGDDNIGQIYYDHAQNDMYFAVQGAVTARLASSGMRFGTSAGTPDTWVHVDGNSDESTGSLTMATPSRINMSNGSTRDVINFGETSGYVRGKITHTVSSGVTYNSSSDYRLKENVNYNFDAITRLKELKPARFNWIAAPDETVDGFLAHEVSDIVPEAVNGTKDAMADKLRVVLDKDGNYLREGVWEENWEKGKLSGEFPSDSTWHETKEYPDHQQMDNARLVPLLTASLQEAITKIETLETANTDLATRITALENA